MSLFVQQGADLNDTESGWTYVVLLLCIILPFVYNRRD